MTSQFTPPDVDAIQLARRIKSRRSVLTGFNPSVAMVFFKTYVAIGRGGK